VQIFAPFHCQHARNCYMTFQAYQLLAITGHTEQIYQKTNVTSSVIISTLDGVWSCYSEPHLVQISALWVHLGTIKHNMFLPATSALTALVTLLLN